MTCRFPFLSIVALVLNVAPLTRGADKPVPAIKHAIIISVDGLRPDLMLRGNAPNMRAMLERGSYSLWARTTPASITLPSHVSMVTGVNPEAHGILWNGELPLKEPIYPNYPTIFELAKRVGLTTAVIAGKEKFIVLDKPGTLDWKYFASTSAESDREVLEHALRAVRDHKPNVMMLHFAVIDVVGHAKGWGSPEQMDAIAEVDKYLGQLFATLDELKLTESTFILLSADHGGQGRVHGPEDPRSRTIPWIVVGPGIRKNYDLTLLGSDSNIDTYDTFTTTCTMIGIPIQRRVKGKFVPQILENPELITPRDGATTQPGK
jgi:predicted AlkP superfamily pyrophosphatase or phosphodiesterase